MSHKRTILITVLASFVVAGTVAATTRDITSRLGGKAGDLFKIVGGLVARTLELSGNLRVDGYIYRGKSGIADGKPVVINDNLQIKGALTVSGLPVTGVKRYSGIIDTTMNGDYIGATTPSSCNGGQNSTKTTSYHWKSIAVSGVTANPATDVRVFTKATSPIPTLGAAYYPNSGNSWTSAGYSLTDGYVWILYKSTNETCGGTITSTAMTSGEYQILVR